MKRLIAVIMIAVMLVMAMATTAFAGVSLTCPPSAPSGVQSIQRAWEKSPINDFMLVYDDEGKYVLLTNSNDMGTVIAAAAAYGSGSTKTAANEMLNGMAEVTDMMNDLVKGTGWKVMFSIHDSNWKKDIINYSPGIGWW